MADVAVEDSVGIVVIGVAGEAPKRQPPPVPSPQHRIRTLHPGVGPSIQTFLLESGQDVLCISDTGEEHTFVQNRLPALGRTSSHQDLKNETGTNSAPHIH